MTIGVVTICYNQSSFLAEAINSVTVSSRHKLEYVIVDPGSIDGSRELIERNKHRFSEIVMEPDSGPADGLNKGFSRLRSAEVCGYLNADDRFAVGTLDFVADYFEANPQVELLLGSIRIIDALGRISLRGRVVDPANLIHFANRSCYFWQQATFFRRQAFLRTKGFNPANRISWDSELVVDMLISGAKVAHTYRVLGDFRIYGGSLTGSGRLAAEAERQHARVVDKILSAECLNVSPVRGVLDQFLYRFSIRRQLCNLAIGLAARIRSRALDWRPMPAKRLRNEDR